MAADSRNNVPSYAAFLDLRGVRVLVVGGGKVAARKVRDLIDCGASVTVVAPEFDADIRARSTSLRLVNRPYRPADLKRQRLVFAATNDGKLNAKICAAADRKGIWANCAAPPEAGNFAVPATVRQGMFCLAISTGGSSPALSAHWRQRLEKMIGPEWGELALLLDEKRRAIKTRILDPEKRRALLMDLAKPHWAAKLKKMGIKEITRRMDELIERISLR